MITSVHRLHPESVKWLQWGCWVGFNNYGYSLHHTYSYCSSTVYSSNNYCINFINLI